MIFKKQCKVDKFNQMQPNQKRRSEYMLITASSRPPWITLQNVLVPGSENDGQGPSKANFKRP